MRNLWGSPSRARRRVATLSLLLLGACSSALDGSSALSKQAVIDAVNIALSENDCSKAIGIIEPVFNSANVDNKIRLARASAYACAANFNFFKLVGILEANTAKLQTNEIWNVMTQSFPSDPANVYDRVVEGAAGATDALLASIRPNTVLLTNYLFNSGGPNPESGNYADRTDESNVYLTFLSMASIGGYHNRFGSPDSTSFKKGNDLPWTTATTAGMDTSGCGYASAVVNFADALGGIQNAATGSLATSLDKVRQVFQTLIYGACNAGCLGVTVGCNKSLSG